MGNDRYRDTLSQGYRLLWYELKSVIGRGGYGITYLAYDTNLDQNVAIKEYLPVDFATRHDDATVHPMTGDQAELFSWGLQAFITEARTLARFRHPNIVTVHSVFEANQTAYMVMEYAQGTDLADYYREQGALTEQQFLDIFLPIADGLALVHEAGFIHRDIKPSNIYIRQDRGPLLLDFGSARQSLEGKTQAMTSLVTYGYAPYEQFNEGKDKQGPWTDIYGLGASIYTGITGDKPVDALKRVSGILDDNVDPYRPVSSLAEGRYSRNFLLSVDYALRFRAEQRPQDIRIWADMLRGSQAAPELPDVGTQPRTGDDEPTRIRPAQSVRPVTSGEAGSDADQVLVDKQPTLYHRLKGWLHSLVEVFDVRPMADRVISAFRKPWYGTITAVAVVLAGLIWIVTSAPWSHAPQVDRESDSVQLPQLTEYLRQADHYFKQQRYTGDAADNALYFYLQAYALDASSPRVNRSIEQLLEREGALIHQAIDDHQFDRAAQAIKRLQRQIPDAMIITGLKNSLDEKRMSVAIQQSLKSADQALADGRLVADKNGAAALYRNVLEMDANNSRARAGLDKVSSQLARTAKADIAAGRYSRAEQQVAALHTLTPDHEALPELQRRIDAANKKQQQISRWLQQADVHYRAGRLTRPADRNALSAYRQVLKLQPDHARARAGIDTIYGVYKRRYDKHLNSRSFDRAQADINVLQSIAGRSQALRKLQAELNSQREQHRQSQAAPPPVEITKPESIAEEPSAKPDKDTPLEDKKRVPLSTFF